MCINRQFTREEIQKMCKREKESRQDKETHIKPTVRHLPTHSTGKDEMLNAVKMWGSGYSP